jgi:AraC-like DNA-binding protein
MSDIEEYKLEQKLMNYISCEKYFLDNKLTLPELAGRIHVSYHQLSRLINKKYRQNFNEFINSRRIDEAKKMLLDERNNKLTIEAIGQNAGFRSKASFYLAFKKYAKCSPKEFIRANSKNHVQWYGN